MIIFDVPICYGPGGGRAGRGAGGGDDAAGGLRVAARAVVQVDCVCSVPVCVGVLGRRRRRLKCVCVVYPGVCWCVRAEAVQVDRVCV